MNNLYYFTSEDEWVTDTTIQADQCIHNFDENYDVISEIPKMNHGLDWFYNAKVGFIPKGDNVEHDVDVNINFYATRDHSIGDFDSLQQPSGVCLYIIDTPISNANDLQRLKELFPEQDGWTINWESESIPSEIYIETQQDWVTLYQWYNDMIAVVIDKLNQYGESAYRK